MTLKNVIVYYHYDVYVVCIDSRDSGRRTPVIYPAQSELNE